jgi:tetratricopeptide (TPR) repeat protein
MQTLIDQLEHIIEQARWPMEHRLTMQSRRLYENALDVVNHYCGHPGVFIEALKIAQATNSCPYAYAAIAFTLTMTASRESNSIASRRGFHKAIAWLEKSQAVEPDRPEINFIEAVIYLNQGQLQNGRLILDHLSTQDSRNYYVCLTEMNYWGQRDDEHQYLHWIHQAMEEATNNYRRAYVLNSLANFHRNKGNYDKSIKLYQKVVEFDPTDPWAWHNMSTMFVTLKQFKNAKICNERALKIMDFSAARQIEQEIKKNTGSLSRLLGR